MYVYQDEESEMFGRFVCLTLLVGCGAASVVRAQEITDPAMLETGFKALEDHRRLAPGETQLYHFEISIGPETPIGYATVSLTGAGTKDALTYVYRNETAIQFPNKARVATSMEATMKANFEPIEIVGRRAQLSPTGERTTSVERAVIGKKTVSLSAKAGDQSMNKTVDRPDEPFVFGIESITQRIDFSKYKEFLIKEFDLRSGGARELIFAMQKYRDGSPTVLTWTPEGATSYQFWYSEDLELVRWGEASMPVLFRRVQKDAYDKLVTSIGTLELDRNEQPPTESKP